MLFFGTANWKPIFSGFRMRRRSVDQLNEGVQERSGMKNGADFPEFDFEDVALQPNGKIDYSRISARYMK